MQYDLINNKSIKLNEKERKRVKEIQLMSTKVLLGTEFRIKEIKEKYFFINNSYYNFNENVNNFCKRLDKYRNDKI